MKKVNEAPNTERQAPATKKEPHKAKRAAQENVSAAKPEAAAPKKQAAESVPEKATAAKPEAAAAPAPKEAKKPAHAAQKPKGPTVQEVTITLPAPNQAKHRRYYKDLCFMVIPLLCMAYYYYGLRPVLMCAVALVTGNLCDRLVAKLRGRAYVPDDYSNESFAMLIALMMPATVSWYVLIVAVLSGVLIGKEAFGGYGSYPFHPSAVGYVVAAVSWPNQVFRYPQPFTMVPLWDTSSVAVQNGIPATLKNGGVPGVDQMDQLLGNYAGPIGTTAILVIVACALFLLVRHDINLYAPLSFLAVIAAIAFIFPRQGGLEGTGILETLPARLNIMRYELLSGAMLFGAVFLMGEPFTSPRRHRSGKILYGALLGAAAMAFRYFGAYDTGLCFALLAVNSISEWLDALVESLHTLTHGAQTQKGGDAA
ncbi:MAG: RnfABCDGE type electron transport complex subunit D [Faecalibacterium sp.]|jgi:electron transport complex protein RnfD|nr:RnfABCDGE type electron transport complex subunit D [Faecalibacterium sp.]